MGVDSWTRHPHERKLRARAREHAVKPLGRLVREIVRGDDGGRSR